MYYTPVMLMFWKLQYLSLETPVNCNELFRSLHLHSLCNHPITNHRVQIFRAIIDKYLNLRLHYVHKVIRINYLFFLNVKGPSFCVWKHVNRKSVLTCCHIQNTRTRRSFFEVQYAYRGEHLKKTRHLLYRKVVWKWVCVCFHSHSIGVARVSRLQFKMWCQKCIE
jgi:hypothetical protein